MTGRCAGGVRPSISSSSVWQTPQVVTRSSTSPSPRDGSGTSDQARGRESAFTGPSSRSSIAFICLEDVRDEHSGVLHVLAIRGSKGLRTLRLVAAGGGDQQQDRADG